MNIQWRPAHLHPMVQAQGIDRARRVAARRNSVLACSGREESGLPLGGANCTKTAISGNIPKWKSLYLLGLFDLRAGFKSPLLHHPVRKISPILENRWKSARLRAIRVGAWTRDTFRGILANSYSRDFSHSNSYLESRVSLPLGAPSSRYPNPVGISR